MCGEVLKSKLAFRAAHMKYTSKFLQGMLLSVIRKMGEHPEQYVRLHIPDREPRLHGVLAPPCRKGAPLFHEQF